MRDLVGLGAVAAVLTLGFAAAEAHDIKVQRKPAAIVVTERTLTPEDKAEVGQAAAERIVEIPACSRKVKVVYAGYGESSRAACETPTR